MVKLFKVIRNLLTNEELEAAIIKYLPVSLLEN